MNENIIQNLHPAILEYIENLKSCPHCGKTEPISSPEIIANFFNEDSYLGLFAKIKTERQINRLGY